MKRHLGVVAAAGFVGRHDGEDCDGMPRPLDMVVVAADSVAATWAVGYAVDFWKASLLCQHRSSIHLSPIHCACLRPRPQSRRQARGCTWEMAETISTFRRIHEQAPSRDFHDYAETASNWLWEIGQAQIPAFVDRECAFGSDPADQIGSTSGLTPSTLKRSRRSGSLSGQPLMHANRSATLYIAPWAATALTMDVKAGSKPVFDSQR